MTFVGLVTVAVSQPSAAQGYSPSAERALLGRTDAAFGASEAHAPRVLDGARALLGRNAEGNTAVVRPELAMRTTTAVRASEVDGERALLGRSTGLAAVRAPAAELSDGRLHAVAQRVIAAHPYLTVFDEVQVTVDSGVVVLRGSVERPHRRERVAASLARLEGVRGVRNDLTVQSQTASDDQIRRRLYERLYFGGVVPACATGWPVHIVVNEARVTLVASAPQPDLPRELERAALSAGAVMVEVRQPAAPRPEVVLATARY